MTNMMAIGMTYILQMELVIGCGQSSKPNDNYSLLLEHSVDQGMTWELVHKGCIPPINCAEYQPPSIFHKEDYTKWKRTIIMLPPSARFT